MKFATPQAPHAHSGNTVFRVMSLVLLALLPAGIAHVYFFGYGLAINFSIAAASGLAFEALALGLRGRSIAHGVADGATLVTAALLAFSMPPLAPWWLTASAMAFAILLAKHLYGGMGRNLFNPAMVGYAVLLVSFPAHMTAWLPPAGVAPVDLTLSDTLAAIFTGHLPAGLSVDLLSGASPLAAVKSGLAGSLTMDEIFAQPLFGDFGGRGWAWIALLTLAGGVLLLAFDVIRWHIPVAMLTGIAVCAEFMHVFDPGRYPGATFHLLSGATVLGAFFIATDPVTAATSTRGRWAYGAGIGVLTYVIRTWGQYHDGVAFAVLLMNMAAPLIDKFTVPRIYGERA